MKARENIVVSSVMIVLFVAWMGFLAHRSPRFAGSGLGSAFGIVGAALMLVPLIYTVRKRVDFLKTRWDRGMSMKTLLDIHVYSGIVGAFLAVVHTGHKFDSWIGTALTSALLLTVISGYIVRYLLQYAVHEISEKLPLLQTARGDLDSAWGRVEKLPDSANMATGFSGNLLLVEHSAQRRVASQVVAEMAGAVADLEYSIRMHEVLKRWFGRALKLHITLSILFYGLLALHLGSGIYYGLRWLQ